MDILFSVNLFLHILGTAALVGGWLVTFRQPTVLRWQHMGAWVQLVTGVLLVGLLEMNDDAGPVNHAKIAVKLLVLIAVVVSAVIGHRKVAAEKPVSTGLAHSVGGLATLNVGIAIFW